MWFYQVFGPGYELGTGSVMLSAEGALGEAKFHAEREKYGDVEAILLSRGRNLTDLSHDKVWAQHIRPAQRLFYVTVSIPPKGSERKTRVWRFAVLAENNAAAVKHPKVVHITSARPDAQAFAVEETEGALDMGVFIR